MRDLKTASAASNPAAAVAATPPASAGSLQANCGLSEYRRRRSAAAYRRRGSRWTRCSGQGRVGVDVSIGASQQTPPCCRDVLQTLHAKPCAYEPAKVNGRASHRLAKLISRQGRRTSRARPPATRPTPCATMQSAAVCAHHPPPQMRRSNPSTAHSHACRAPTAPAGYPAIARPKKC